MTQPGEHGESTPSPFWAGLRCRCPRCGKGKLFCGFLQMREECDNCHLDFSFANAGDGPAVFIIMIAGFIVCGAALYVEVHYMPPLWLHAALWLPLGIALPLALLRPAKAIIVALQYRHGAAEGRRADDADSTDSR